MGCKITKLSDLKTIPKGQRSKIARIHAKIGRYNKQRKRINGRLVSSFDYSWIQAKESGLISIEEIAYLMWSSKIWSPIGTGLCFLGKTKYNVLLRSVKKYPHDKISSIVKKIDAMNRYKTCVYTGPVFK